MDGKILTFRDGHVIEIVGTFADGDHDVLELRHEIPSPGRMAGPHWHPDLTEVFRVRRGRMRFRVDRNVTELGPDDELTIRPGHVHEFWTLGRDVEVEHAISPPAHHREMFETWHRLDAEYRTNRFGVPRNPLDLATLWELQDGYLAGIPAWLQRLVFPPLARLARRRGRVTVTTP
ncbi:cupin domain-containing protein [Gordonia sp. SID5947]|uniref:cupin domain-containing protein n=1 Tax=Gordonia sp. SID5947 TaxID=2690315 RepID=UPI001369FA8F|nr:cupin domain-containing protein [Gordonia sp. SID5947]MYR05125.1 cupin domain-containing protein [Gordonia sp. SID5947]